MVAMRERQREVQLYRGQVPSPGRPTVAWRQGRVGFWAAIARGEKTDGEHRGQVEPPPIGGDVGDVARAYLVGPSGAEPAAHQVRRCRPDARGTAPAWLAPFVDAADAVVAHEQLDTLVVHLLPLSAQLRGHPGRSVRPTGLGVDLFDRLDELGLGQLRGAGPRDLAGGPAAASGGSRRQPGTTPRPEPLGPPGSHLPVAGHWPDSSTQKAVVRLAAHTPVRSFEFSRRNRTSSERSSVVRPGFTRRSTRARRIQLPRFDSPIPKSRATRATGPPSPDTNAAPSALNS